LKSEIVIVERSDFGFLTQFDAAFDFWGGLGTFYAEVTTDDFAETSTPNPKKGAFALEGPAEGEGLCHVIGAAQLLWGILSL
jgi:hypothetical protein